MWSASARKLVRDGVEHACVENIQACILAGNICLADCQPDSESIFFGSSSPITPTLLTNSLIAVANRMAEILKLSRPDPADGPITVEIKRRVWWSLFMIDRWASAGLGLARQIHVDDNAPPLPMEEVQFRLLSSVQGSDTVKVWNPGIWSHMIALVKIFGDIQDFNKMLVEAVDWEEDYIETQVLHFAELLTAFERELPPAMSVSPENLDFQASRGVGRAFVALHLGYHHYATLLYYQYLDQRRPSTSTKRIFTERCKYHAIAFCELICMAAKQGAVEALHNVVGHSECLPSSASL